MTDWPFADREEEARALEAYETPEWCVEAILRVELMPQMLWDPCCGNGVMAEVAKRHGYEEAVA